MKKVIFDNANVSQNVGIIIENIEDNIYLLRKLKKYSNIIDKDFYESLIEHYFVEGIDLAIKLEDISKKFNIDYLNAIATYYADVLNKIIK